MITPNRVTRAEPHGIRPALLPRLVWGGLRLGAEPLVGERSLSLEL